METSKFKSLFPMLRTSDSLDKKLLDFFWRESEDPSSKNYDLITGETQWVLEMPLPGLKKEDVNISLVRSRVLKIESEKKSKWFGSKKMEFLLSEDADLELIDAEMNEGILTIKIPKRKTSIEKTIKIK